MPSYKGSIMVTLSLEVKDVQPSKLVGVKTARAEGNGVSAQFDLIEGLYALNAGDRIEVLVDENKPEDLESYEFCGHGYLVTDESKGFTLLSLWGILFKFEPPLGLKLDQKYYICIRRS
jgi:DNA-directed RNA polymerase subunit G